MDGGIQQLLYALIGADQNVPRINYRHTGGSGWNRSGNALRRRAGQADPGNTVGGVAFGDEQGRLGRIFPGEKEGIDQADCQLGARTVAQLDAADAPLVSPGALFTHICKLQIGAEHETHRVFQV